MFHHDDGRQHEYLESGVWRERPWPSRLVAVFACLLFTAGFAAVVRSASSPPYGAGLTATAATGPSPGANGGQAYALISGWARIAYGAVEARSAEAPTTTITVPAKPAASADHSVSGAANTSHLLATAQASPSYGCSAAYAWLEAHAAPGFRFICPGYALGHQAMTCEDVPGVCPGTAVIVIAVPCPAAYMNEAHNSWIVAGLAGGSFDPYGYCH